jgi:hypothetical protein
MGEILNPPVQYRLELLKESMQISGQLLLIRLGLKTVSPDELDFIQMRASVIRKLIQEIKS